MLVLQDDMNLTEEKKAPLRARDLGFKRNMLSMHMKGAAKVRLICVLAILVKVFLIMFANSLFREGI